MGAPPTNAGNRFLVAVRAWAPTVYAFFCLLGAPALAYTFMPLDVLRYCFMVVSGAFAFVAFWVLLETCTAVLSTCASAARVTVSLDTDLKKKWPPVTYIVPAYLDNEAPILDDTLAAYKRLNYAGPLTIMIVYNTRKSMPAEEAELRSKWHNRRCGHMRVRVLGNPGSRSKAENVNRGLSELPPAVKYVFIMDADHHPRPDHAAYAVATMERFGYDVLQGACTIRRDGFLSNIVAAEFEDMYNVGHRGRTSLFGIGMFGGSNGCWRRDLLARICMDPTMLTEDIDSSVRATLEGCKIGYSSHLISSEEAPERERTLRKQRLRWAQGWFEISLKHIVPLMLSPYTSIRQKIGFFTLLSFREFFVYVTFHPLILLIAHRLRSNSLTLEIFFVAAGAAIFSVGTIRVCAAYALSQGEVRHSASVFVLYALVQLFWTCYLNIIQVIAHGQHFIGQNAWVPTVRESASKVSLQEELLTGAEAELRHNASSSEISVSLGSDRFEDSDDGVAEARVASGAVAKGGPRSAKASMDAGSRGMSQPYTPQGYTPRGLQPRTPGGRVDTSRAGWPGRRSDTWSSEDLLPDGAPLGLHEVERQRQARRAEAAARRAAAEAQQERGRAQPSPLTPPRSPLNVQLPGVYMGEPRKPFVDTGDRQMMFFNAAYTLAAQQQVASMEGNGAPLEGMPGNNIIVLPFMPTNSSFRMGSSMMGMGSEQFSAFESQSAPLRMLRPGQPRASQG